MNQKSLRELAAIERAQRGKEMKEDRGSTGRSPASGSGMHNESRGSLSKRDEQTQERKEIAVRRS